MRTHIWVMGLLVLVVCGLLLYVSQHSSTPSVQTVQQPVAPEPAPKKVARTATPVVAESDELRFRITKVTMAAQRPLPPAPQRQPESEQGSNQSPVNVTQ